jgi:hypothetical protein
VKLPNNYASARNLHAIIASVSRKKEIASKLPNFYNREAALKLIN